jgi:hypothetical protein
VIAKGWLNLEGLIQGSDECPSRIADDDRNNLVTESPDKVQDQGSIKPYAFASRVSTDGTRFQ